MSRLGRIKHHCDQYLINSVATLYIWLDLRCLFGIEAKNKTRTEQKRRPGLEERLESFPLLYLELKRKEFYITDKSRVMRKYVYCRGSETISGSILMTENISKTMNYPLSLQEYFYRFPHHPIWMIQDQDQDQKKHHVTV